MRSNELPGARSINPGEVVILPKRPSGEWRFLDHQYVLGYPAERWVSREGHIAISGVEVAEDNHSEKFGPEYHVSISKQGGRVPAEEVADLLKAFGMEGADEDNHVPGIARHFWLPVAGPYAGFVCPCKQTEHAITERDYVWRPQK